jgi:hypothetical protein
VDQCADEGPVIITRNGKPVAVLLAPANEEDLDRLMLARSPRFQALLGKSRRARVCRETSSGARSRRGAAETRDRRTFSSRTDPDWRGFVALRGGGMWNAFSVRAPVRRRDPGVVLRSRRRGGAMFNAWGVIDALSKRCEPCRVRGTMGAWIRWSCCARRTG